MIIMNGEQRSKIMYNNTTVGNIQDIFHDYMVEEDGTIWLHFFHQNCASGDYFTAGAQKTNRDNFTFVSTECWNAGPLIYTCDHGDNYEFLVTQQKTVGGTPTRHRWIQTVNPYSATSLSAAKVTTTIEGCTSCSGGIYIVNNQNNFWINAPSWFGGGWTGVTWSGGNPGWNKEVVKGNQDIYIRVYSIER